jgi:transcriptional regulator
MYTPKAFLESDPEEIREFIHDNNFGTLVSWDGKTPLASHLLFAVEAGRTGKLSLNCHLARANDQWRTFKPDQEVLAIFGGAHTYISPRWYEQTEANVPTWNYMAVHAYGIPRLITDQAELRRLLKKLVDRYESDTGVPQPYQVESMPADLLEEKMKGVVGVQILVTKIQAKFKLSQNRTRAERENVAAQLEERSDANSLGIARAMRQTRFPDPGE